MCEKKKDQIKLVNKCLIVDSKSSYVWVTHMGLPALHAKNCEGKGKHRAIDGGLACYNFWSARKKSGNSNPT